MQAVTNTTDFRSSASTRGACFTVAALLSLTLAGGCGSGASTMEPVVVPAPEPAPPTTLTPDSNGCYHVTAPEGPLVLCPDAGAPPAPPPAPAPVPEQPPPPAMPDAGAPDLVPPAPICVAQELAPELAPPPNLLLTVDHSQSMTYAPGDGSMASKWSQLSHAIHQVVPAVDAKVRWGLAVFPDVASVCAPGGVVLDVADGNGTNVLSSLTMVGPPGHGGTPTSATLQSILGYMPLRDAGRPNFIILATDGRPTCKGGDYDDVTGADDEATRQAVDALRQAGIRTFIVGFGDSVNTSNQPLLNDLAHLGGTERQGAPTAYYNAGSLSDLQSALTAIGASVRCSYTLESVPSNPFGLEVTFDGAPVANDPVDGWQYDVAANTISFAGAACAAVGDNQVQTIKVANICPPADSPTM